MAASSLANTKREHTSTKVLNYLCAMAKGGDLKPGDRLQTERDLARHLRISRPSLREGIGYLTTFGVLKSIRGVGTFVVKDLRYAPLVEFCELNNFPAWKMLEARLAIEPHVAALAAQRATKPQIVQLAKELAAMRAAVDSPELYHIHDIHFHQIVALASGNPVLIGLVDAITISAIVDEANGQATGQVSGLARSLELHRKIYSSIRSRNPSEARLAMQRSLELSHAAITSGAPEAPSEGVEALPVERKEAQVDRVYPAVQPALHPLGAWSGISSRLFGLPGVAPGTR